MATQRVNGWINRAMERKLISCCFLVWILLLPVTTGNAYPELDVQFTDFLREHGYRGGALSAMRDGRLLAARGYGHDRSGRAISAYSKFPVSSLAKSFTAVAIMHLVEKGTVTLDDKVFGLQGILRHIKPFSSRDIDPRLYDVTVNHLLHHSGGWDEKRGPLYDPVFNAVYLKRGHKVPDIAKEMGKFAPFNNLLPKEIISYVISQPLHFTPGTEQAYSNTGYLLLGRVIEQLTGMEYRDYVKRIILDRCGMWNTRLDTSHYIGEEVLHTPADDRDSSVMNVLHPSSIDSTLGWYSNVYDLMRFSRCLFHTKILLGEKFLNILLSKPVHSQREKAATSWYASGFRVSDKGAVWQDADPQTDDLILYYRKPTRVSHNSKLAVHIQIDKEKSDKNQTPHESFQVEDVPDSWVILLSDKSVNHLRHQTKEIMASVKPSRFHTNLGIAQENIFLYDLSELHRHPSWEPLESKQSFLIQTRRQISVRYKIDEHHLTAYVNALRAESFAVHSFTSFTHKQHTFFLVVGKKDPSPAKPDIDFVFEHGMDHRQLLKTKLKLEEKRYNMTLLHSYTSQSHRSHSHSYAALFNNEAFTNDMLMKYGTSHLPEPYEKLVQMYHEQNFYPLSETVVFHNKDEKFSFIFIKKIGGNIVDFRQYYNLSEKKLSQLTEDNAKENMHLSYLNAYSVYGKSRFSAVYTNATHYKGVLELDQPTNRATEITIFNLRGGLTPKQMVPYFDANEKLKIAAYYEEM